MKINDKLATSEERKELKYVGVPRVRLQYLKQSKEMGAWARKIEPNVDMRMWNLVEPRLPGYKYDGGYPTFTVEGLRKVGVL